MSDTIHNNKGQLPGTRKDPWSTTPEGRKKFKKFLIESIRIKRQYKDVVALMREFIDSGLYLPTGRTMVADERQRLNYFLQRLRRYEKKKQLVCRKDGKGRRYFKDGEPEEIVKAFSLGGDMRWDYRLKDGEEVNWGRDEKKLRILEKITNEIDSDEIIGLEIEEVLE